MKLKITPFGNLEDKANNRYTFTSGKGIIFTVMNYGATLVDVIMPDREGHSAQLITGLDNLEQYQESASFYGATVGRFANRIKGASFTIDGTEYNLAQNDGKNNLHGGPNGFEAVYWEAEVIESSQVGGVKFSYTSRDGESGFPGTLHVSVSYIFSDAGEITIQYHATTDKATPINLTNHTYWNLAGMGQGITILDQILRVNSLAYTPVEEGNIPSGVIAPVEGTPFDFRQAKPVGHDSSQKGYDHNWVLKSKDEQAKLTEAAILVDKKSGRSLTVYTDQPGIQIYSTHGVSGGKERSGETYSSMAIALETQNFPNSINEPDFPNALLRPGEVYESTTIFKLDLIED